MPAQIYSFIVHLIVSMLMLDGTARAAGESWRFVANAGQGWCTLESPGEKIQVWFGRSSGGGPILTVDAKQMNLGDAVRIDDVRFSVRGRPSEIASWREMQIRNDRIEAFIVAFAHGRTIRAGIWNASLAGSQRAVTDIALENCLVLNGWEAALLPRHLLGTPASRLAEKLSPPPLVLTGEIDDALVEKVYAHAYRWGERPTILLGPSDGGNVDAAMTAARLLRSVGATVVVRGTCASACVMVAAGGARRILSDGARLGIHRGRFTRIASADEGMEVIAITGAFYREMGIDPELALLEAAIPNHRIRWLSRREAIGLGLVTQ